MNKTLTVATEVQKVVLERVLLAEIAGGFWKNARPSDHADAWAGVVVVTGTVLGAVGFEIPRNYNFVNPEFFKKTGDTMLAAALTVNPNITVRQLKKQLISLNQILGARLKEIGGDIAKLKRGRKNSTLQVTQTIEKNNTRVTVRKAMANIVEAESEVE
jgi:hypothetical protein